jgi:hypothetical protein
MPVIDQMLAWQQTGLSDRGPLTEEVLERRVKELEDEVGALVLLPTPLLQVRPHLRAHNIQQSTENSRLSAHPSLRVLLIIELRQR